MPRSGFKKSHLGCTRCKQRKVKCDEMHPVCGGCRRLDLACVYDRFVPKSKRLHQNGNAPSAALTAPSGAWQSRHSSCYDSSERTERHLLEIRLLYHFTTSTSGTFSPEAQAWNVAAPALATEKQFLLDAMLALSSLHRSRLEFYEKHLESISHEYFGRAIRGQHQGLAGVTDLSTAEALFLTSTLINLHIIATMNDRVELGNPLGAICNWMRVTSGAKLVFDACVVYQSASSLISQAFLGTRNLFTSDRIFPAASREHLKHILDFGTDFETMTSTDRTVYEDALSYIGCMTLAVQDGEHPLHTCRRLFALPAMLNERFIDLVHERRPRALVMMAHAFAVIKTLDCDELWWCEGVVERQVQLIYENVPPGWRTQLQEPMRAIGLKPTLKTENSMSPGT